MVIGRVRIVSSSDRVERPTQRDRGPVSIEPANALAPIFDDLNRYEAMHFNGQSAVILDGDPGES